MIWTVARRHELTLLLDRDLAEPRRLTAVAQAAGLKPPPALGVEPSFMRLSRLVAVAAAEDKLDGLLDAAKPAVTEATRVLLDGMTVDSEAETEWSEPETVREEVDTIIDPNLVVSDVDSTIIDPAVEDEDEEETDHDSVSTDPKLPAIEAEPDGAAPRPAGTPAQAPPTEGAQTWIVRRVHLSTPTTTKAGESITVGVTLATADASTVATAPADAAPWAGPPVEVEAELWLEEAFPAPGVELHRSLSIGGDDGGELSFDVVAADPLSDGVDVSVRFYVRGFEVGRARTFVPNRDREDVQPRAGTPGAMVVPDTILS